MTSQVFLIRHGETEWALSGRHTGSSDIPLTAAGEAQARALVPRLARQSFSRVLVSPRVRARRTCELAGLGAAAVVEPDLAEWDYGDYEGLTTAQVHQSNPGWDLFRDGCPGGESVDAVAERADRLFARLRPLGGTLALFTHGHFGRVLAARWAQLPARAGERLLLDPASLSILAYEHGNPEHPVIALLNEQPGS